jgi:hypothetical protein
MLTTDNQLAKKIDFYNSSYQNNYDNQIKLDNYDN